MDCREYKNQIVPFLKEELDERQIKKLLLHVEDCPSCKEELKMQYLVKEGLSRLENGGTFDLQKDFEMKLDEERRTSDKLCLLQTIFSVIKGAGILLVVASLIINII